MSKKLMFITALDTLLRLWNQSSCKETASWAKDTDLQVLILEEEYGDIKTCTSFFGQLSISESVHLFMLKKKNPNLTESSK